MAGVGRPTGARGGVQGAAADIEALGPRWGRSRRVGSPSSWAIAALRTITATLGRGLVVAGREHAVAKGADSEAMPTATTINSLYHLGLPAAFTAQVGGQTGASRRERGIEEPLSTVTTDNHRALVVSNMAHNVPRDAAGEPVATVTTGAKLYLAQPDQEAMVVHARRNTLAAAAQDQPVGLLGRGRRGLSRRSRVGALEVLGGHDGDAVAAEVDLDEPVVLQRADDASGAGVVLAAHALAGDEAGGLGVVGLLVGPAGRLWAPGQKGHGDLLSMGGMARRPARRDICLAAGVAVGAAACRLGARAGRAAATRCRALDRQPCGRWPCARSVPL